MEIMDITAGVTADIKLIHVVVLMQVILVVMVSVLLFGLYYLYF